MLYGSSVERAATQNLTRDDSLLPGSSDAPDVDAPQPSQAGSARTRQGQDPAKPISPVKERPKVQPGKQALNYLLMGSDSRSSGNAGAGRSDVLILAHLSADRKSAYLISFPRDMWVDIPGYNRAKINAAFAWGGPPLTVRTVEGLTDTRIDHVALIDFDGFIRLTDQLGGVTVYNKYYSKSRGYEFPVGDITIRGDQALAYVRERKQLPQGDLDRAERQRAVLKAILAKTMSPETIANPRKFSRVVGTVASNITVDSGLTDAKLRKTALSLRLTPGEVHLLQAPISGFGTSADGQSIDVVDTPKMNELATALKNDEMADYVKKYPSG